MKVNSTGETSICFILLIPVVCGRSLEIDAHFGIIIAYTTQTVRLSSSVLFLITATRNLSSA